MTGKQKGRKNKVMGFSTFDFLVLVFIAEKYFLEKKVKQPKNTFTYFTWPFYSKSQDTFDLIKTNNFNSFIILTF